MLRMQITCGKLTFAPSWSMHDCQRMKLELYIVYLCTRRTAYRVLDVRRRFWFWRGTISLSYSRRVHWRGQTLPLGSYSINILFLFYFYFYFIWGGGGGGEGYPQLFGSEDTLPPPPFPVHFFRPGATSIMACMQYVPPPPHPFLKKKILGTPLRNSVVS